MTIETIGDLTRIRLHEPERIREAANNRVRPTSPVGEHGKAMIIAADHPARASLGAGARAMAMADRPELLQRLCTALDRPGVTGVLGTADILDDLLLLGVLEGKTVFGSMNRGGLAKSRFEVDDRYTGLDAKALSTMGYEGGKLLLRIDMDDDKTAPALESAARAVSSLTRRRKVTMIEPFLARSRAGRLVNDLSPEAVATSITIAAGLGASSAYSWLKIPVIDDMERVVTASTLPTVLLGGDVSADRDAQLASWAKALRLPHVCGLAVGRSLLYPDDDDVAAAVDTAVSLLSTSQPSEIGTSQCSDLPS